MFNYKVYMPIDKRVYNVMLPTSGQFISNPCNLTIGTSEVFNAWFSITGATVTSNASKWDVVDDDVSYERIEQLCQVTPTGGVESWRVEALVDKDLTPTAFIQCRITQYSEYQIGGTQILIADNAVNFKLDDGLISERLNPGGVQGFAEDLGSQWNFITEFSKLASTEVICVLFYPAVGNSWPNELASATGTATTQCITGYQSAYVPV